jgi:hypothetical protein
MINGIGFYHYVWAIHKAETPKGKFLRFNQKLSAPKILPNKLFSIEILILFSDSGRKPVARIKSLPNKIGAKKVILIYVARLILKPAPDTTLHNC